MRRQKKPSDFGSKSSSATTCKYCKSYDHTIEECPILIDKIKDPKPAVNQNIELIATE